MGIQLVKGDILKSNCQVTTITINCVGAMGKGLALTAAKKYPYLETEYKRLCIEKYFSPGDPKLLSIEGKKFLLFPTKDHWRHRSKIEWIDNGLQQIRQNIHIFESLALPPLGCGNGGLNFYSVFNLMLKHLEGLDCKIDIYVPSPKGES